jgi:hypothetical protein
MNNLDELKQEVISKLEDFELSCKNPDGTWKSDEDKLAFSDLIDGMTKIMREDKESRNLV